MPKFIYTISIIILFILGGILSILFLATPDTIIVKITISFLIAIFVLLTIPLIITIYKFFKKSKEEPNLVFKKVFKGSLLISLVIGFLIFLKSLKIFSFNTLITLLFVILLTKFALPFVKKPRKKAKY